MSNKAVINAHALWRRRWAGALAGAFWKQRLHDLMDYLVAEAETALLRQTIAGTPGVNSVHDIPTRKMGDLIVDDAHIEVEAMLTVEARRRAKTRSREGAGRRDLSAEVP